jgi:TonB family protein
MKPSPTMLTRLVVFVAWSLCCAQITSAQFSKLDDLASEITKEVKRLKPQLVAVVDFRQPSGSTMPQSHYFAWILSNYLEQHGKKKFAVAEHRAFDEDLARLHIPPESLVLGAAFRSAASHVGADVLITGTIEKRQNAYVLQATVLQVSNEKSLATFAQTIEVNDFLESFVTPFPQGVERTGRNGGLKGVKLPSCVYCPDPSYNDLARSKNLQGSCVLEVLISANGDLQQIRPLRLLGYGLDEQAFNAIKKWKFKPATREDGTPVATIVPVEVTFRLY